MFNWTGLFLFLATAVTFFVFGMVIMAVCATNSQYKATTEAFNAGYERGKTEETMISVKRKKETAREKNDKKYHT